MPTRLKTQFFQSKLCAINLILKRGDSTLVEGLSFEVHPGQALVVTGQNGVGKSTLLRALGGLFAPSAGRVEVLETGADAATGSGCGLHCHYLGHQDALRGALTLQETLTTWKALLHVDRPGLTVVEALESIGLGRLAHLPAAALSAGQKRRAGFARLLAAPRPIWLLDEPLTALDAEGQALVTNLAQNHLHRGGIVIAATHAPLTLSPARELRLGGET